MTDEQFKEFMSYVRAINMRIIAIAMCLVILIALLQFGIGWQLAVIKQTISESKEK